MDGTRNDGVIAREGFPFVLGAFLFTAACGALSLSFGSSTLAIVTAALFAVTFWVIWFFRNPERTPPDGDDLVISPADGRVLHAVEVDDPQWSDGGRVVKVSIFMNVFNVHVNRVPVSGTVIRQKYHPGKFLVASLDKTSAENERSGLTIRDAAGRVYTVVQIAGLVARRIATYPKEGDRLVRGNRYGLIRFGSRLELYLPRGTEIRVREGERTRAGETIIGVLPTAEPMATPAAKGDEVAADA
jgi:phosphatidylserine decarboxylase